MSKTISLYEQLSEFWTDSIKLKNRTRETYDKELSARYNILLTFKANDLFINETISIVNDYDCFHMNYIHNKYTTCLLFPHYGIRIACSKSFIENLPFVKAILSGDWKDDNIFQDEFYNEDLKEMVKGSVNIVITENPLDSILYDKPIESKVCDYQQKNYFTIVELTCSNLKESIILANKVRYENENFEKSGNV
jgi:hypothetical protein